MFHLAKTQTSLLLAVFRNCTQLLLAYFKGRQVFSFPHISTIGQFKFLHIYCSVTTKVFKSLMVLMIGFVCLDSLPTKLLVAEGALLTLVPRHY